MSKECYRVVIELNGCKYVDELFRKSPDDKCICKIYALALTERGGKEKADAIMQSHLSMDNKCNRLIDELLCLAGDVNLTIDNRGD